MSDKSRRYRVTISTYQRAKLESVTGEKNLASAITKFVNKGEILPPTDDDSPRSYERVYLSVDTALKLLGKGSCVSKGLLNIMGIIPVKPSARTHKNIAVTHHQYELLKVLGGGDVDEGLRLVLGA